MYACQLSKYNAPNSSIAWYIFIKFCILIHFNIMQKGGEALLGISPAGRVELLEIFIALEPNGIFGSNFA